jgi:hypothetical protein
MRQDGLEIGTYNLTGYRTQILSATTHTLSAWVFHNSTAPREFWWRYNAVNSPGVMVPPNTWTRVTAVVTGTGIATAYAIQNGMGFAAGESVWVDAIQLEEKPYATSYTDGSLGVGYTWTGAAHASASVRDRGSIRIEHAGRMSQVQGSILARVRRAFAGNPAPRIFQLGADGNGMLARYATAGGSVVQFFHYGGGVVRYVYQDTASAVGGRDTMYLEWTADTYGLSVNGAPVTRGSTVPGDSSHSLLYVLAGVANTPTINGDSDGFIAFDRTLTDAERARLLALPDWTWESVTRALTASLGAAVITIPPANDLGASISFPGVLDLGAALSWGED